MSELRAVHRAAHGGPGLAVVIALLTCSSLAAQTLRLAPQPSLSIGGLTEDAHYMLSQVVGGIRLGDGHVVIADRFNNTLRMYDARGRFVREVGGEGQGPGEYEFITGFGRCESGQVVAFDIGWRMTFYDEDLTFLHERTAHVPELVQPYKFACAPSGYWIASGWGDIQGQFRAGLYEATSRVLLGRGDSIAVDFGERLSSQRMGTVDGEGNPTGSGPHPFGRSTVMAIAEDRVYLGDGGEYLIESYSLTGDTLPPIEWRGPDRRIKSTDVDAYVDEMLEGVPAERAPELRRRLEKLLDVSSFPAYDELRIGTDESLWVREFHRPGSPTTRWIVFDGGSLRGQLELPSTSELLDVGPDYILLLERDEFDVESVRLYGLGT